MTQKRPKKAVILAAGLGTRMLPLSNMLPKPLIPFWGKPILAHNLDLLHSWGVKDVLINCHHKAEMMMSALQKIAPKGLRISLSFEPEILGTGGALRHAQWFLDGMPFWMMNADIAVDLKPDILLRSLQSPRHLASLWVHPSRGPRTVDVKDGRITRFQSPLPGAKNTYTFCGLQLLTNRILDYLPEEGCSSIIDAYLRAMKKGWSIRGVEVPHSYWADIGTPEQYLVAHKETFEAYKKNQPGKRFVFSEARARICSWHRKGVSIEGFAALDNRLTLAKGTHIENAILWEGVSSRPKTLIRGAIVGSNTNVQGEVSHIAIPATQALESSEMDGLAALGWDILHTTAHLFLPRGSERTLIRVQQQSKKAILIRYLSKREENTYYTRHARFLKKIGVHVPAILENAPNHDYMIMEDLGNRTLKSQVPGPKQLQLYEAVLDDVYQLHHKGKDAAGRQSIPLMLPFSSKLYRWEHNLFIENFISRQIAKKKVDTKHLLAELHLVAQQLSREPYTLIHRDLQSTNIMIHKNQPYLIDFQGMRFGPPSYDLASFLCDPYVELSEKHQLYLLRYYAQTFKGTSTVESTFWWAAIQRLVQALGAYGRLAHLPGCERFSVHYKPGLRMLNRALTHLPPLAYLRELTRMLS
ncbi:MAG: phosphotransferase [Kiritimatiellae bacterium]|nr:phosphotransferase [Kiritimatiellia bacterium]